MTLAAVATLPGKGGTLDERLVLADEAVRKAASAGAGLVVLPEAYLPGYAHVRAECGDIAKAWSLAAAASHGIAIAVGYLDGDGCFLGVAAPGGSFTAYRKRFPSPAEARVWRGGDTPVIVTTPVGRVGLLICADVLQLDAWTPYVGRVDAVAVAAAWPDYRGRLGRTPRLMRPALRWLYDGSVPYRDALLVRAAAAVGAPVLFADASGPLEGEERFSVGTRIVEPDGTLTTGTFVVRPTGSSTPGPALVHTGRWAPFTAVYRRAGRVRAG